MERAGRFHTSSNGPREAWPVCVPHVGDLLHLGPSWISHSWISPASVPHPQECGCWAMGALQAGACPQSSPRGGLGSVPERAHGAGWQDTG